MMFHVPTKVILGPGTLSEVPEQAKALGGRRVMLVCGKHIAASGHADALRSMLEDAGLFVTDFANVEPDPSVDTIHAGALVARDQAADMVVAIGGGSSMDAGKAMAVLATNEGSVADYEGPHAYANAPLPTICIPTTAGTASEVTPFSVITDVEQQRKFVMSSPQLHPRVAVLDPALLATASPATIAAAGMDALTHAIESYLSKLAHPHTEICSLEAVRLIGENLRRLVADPGHGEAGLNMLIAANIAGFAFSNTRLGIVHAMALPPGARFGLAHGAANSILLPHGMAFNRIAAQQRLCDIAEALGENVEHLPAREAALAAIAAVQALITDIHAPTSLQALGVEPDKIPAMAEDAMKSGHIAVNPRQVSLAEVRAIYEAAM